MRSRTFFKHIFLFTVVLVLTTASFGQTRFRVTIDPSLAVEEPISGRMLVFMTKSDKTLDTIAPDYADPNAVWVTGAEFTNLSPGRSFVIDGDTTSFPERFSNAPAGEYQVMALLDRNHSYTYWGRPDGGDIVSVVQKLTLPAGETAVTLSKVILEAERVNHPNVKFVEFESPMLSAFWGRPMTMEAGVVLPPKYFEAKTAHYPTAYIIHGYGGGGPPPKGAIDQAMKQFESGELPEMIYVFLNAHASMGHHVFADSVNNGPWGTALVKEFIPYLEKQFRMDARPSGRFLTGHSSGGWATLWVMTTHPDFFGGTWSTSPDPVDFRNFTGPDLTRYPPQNAYSDSSGKDYGLVRINGKDVAAVRQYTKQEMVLGYYGGQFSSFNAVFSPKGPDGQPMKLFDPDTGRIDPLVQKAWEKYDISRLLRENWQTLGPKLKGKIHIVVGTADTFHLDEPTRLLDAELRKLGSDAKFEYLEGRTHFDLYEGGLRNRFFKEMYAMARPDAH